MDLLSSIRKSGSRGGVNFSWDEVHTSQHRENYLGHSLMAPVGRWQKGKDLSWYAKGDDEGAKDGETAEDRRVRERKEEIRKIKEAEEDALARALGLPVADRGPANGANAISVGEVNRVVRETGLEMEGGGEAERGKGFGDFVGKVADGEVADEQGPTEPEKGGLLGKKVGEREGRRRDDSRERRQRRHRHRSRSGERRRHRSRSGERHRHRHRHDEERKELSRSPDRRERRHRSRSADRRRPRRDDWEPRRDNREPGRDIDRRPRRSRSPDFRDNRGRRDR